MNDQCELHQIILCQILIKSKPSPIMIIHFMTKCTTQLCSRLFNAQLICQKFQTTTNTNNGHINPHVIRMWITLSFEIACHSKWFNDVFNDCWTFRIAVIFYDTICTFSLALTCSSSICVLLFGIIIIFDWKLKWWLVKLSKQRALS